MKSLSEAVIEYELQLDQKNLERCENKEEAAGLLGIRLSSLTRRMRKIQSKNGVKTDLRGMT